MNTTFDTTTATKTEVIAFLIDNGVTDKTARALRDVRVADLKAMAQAALEEQSRKETEAAMAEPATPEAGSKSKRGALTLTAGVTLDDIVGEARYTVGEVAEMVGLTKFAVRRWVRVGYLPTETDPQAKRGEFAIPGDALRDFIASRLA